MPSEFAYGTFANFSPRGTGELSLRSKAVCGRIKAGDIALTESAVAQLAGPGAAVLQPFLNPGITLVPVPRSAPLTENAVWPSKVIADVLLANGYGDEGVESGRGRNTPLRIWALNSGPSLRLA